MSDYTADMVSAIRKAEPLTFEAAVALSERDDFIAAGKSHRSVIAKAKSLGIEYQAKQKAPAKGRGVTKAQVVEAIEMQLRVPAGSLEGLEGSKMASLDALLGRLTEVAS